MSAFPQIARSPRTPPHNLLRSIQSYPFYAFLRKVRSAPSPLPPSSFARPQEVRLPKMRAPARTLRRPPQKTDHSTTPHTFPILAIFPKYIPLHTLVNCWSPQDPVSFSKTQIILPHQAQICVKPRTTLQPGRRPRKTMARDHGDRTKKKQPYVGNVTRQGIRKNGERCGGGAASTGGILCDVQSAPEKTGGSVWRHHVRPSSVRDEKLTLKATPEEDPGRACLSK